MAGIFIGLQVDDWNNLRKDRKDEQHYLNRLHDEVASAERLSARVLGRRIERQSTVIELLNAVLVDLEQSTLTEDHCDTIGSMHFFNVAVTGLSAIEELTASGRMDILQDRELRAALGALKQTQEATNTYIRIQYSAAYDLPHDYPDLIEVRAFLDVEQREVSSRTTCNLTAMRQNPNFLNDLSTNADVYDAYIRDALAPWAQQMELVHRLIDRNLGIHHEATMLK